MDMKMSNGRYFLMLYRGFIGDHNKWIFFNLYSRFILFIYLLRLIYNANTAQLIRNLTKIGTTLHNTS